MRQFLALELSDEMRAELSSLERRLSAESAGWRWLSAAGIHLTLRFLGDVSPEVDARARPAWREVVSRAPRMELGLFGIGRFPPRGRPRVLWVGVRELGSTGRLEALGAALEFRAREVGFEPERRPFRPHLTLARASRTGSGTLPATDEFVSATTLSVDRVVLFRSELFSSGARYTALASLPLLGR